MAVSEYIQNIPGQGTKGMLSSLTGSRKCTGRERRNHWWELCQWISASSICDRMSTDTPLVTGLKERRKWGWAGAGTAAHLLLPSMFALEVLRADRVCGGEEVPTSHPGHGGTTCTGLRSAGGGRGREARRRPGEDAVRVPPSKDQRQTSAPCDESRNWERCRALLSARDGQVQTAGPTRQVCALHDPLQSLLGG